MHAPAFYAFPRRLIATVFIVGCLSSPSRASADGGVPPGTFSVESFQTDYFAGSATANVPLVVPTGAAGVAPQLTLLYNSTTADDLAARRQGQWNGLRVQLHL